MTNATAKNTRKSPATTQNELIATVQPTDIPTVPVPRPLAIVGTALSQSRDGFIEVWAYEKEHEIGLQALKLVGTAASKLGKPIGQLAVVGAASLVAAATGPRVRAVVKAHWQKIQGWGRDEQPLS
ncbi:MAG: hypothetical protein AAGC54_14455 [Cyanobacteria bacterium P01_F01_bin.4]